MSVFSDSPVEIPTTAETHAFMVAAYASKRGLSPDAPFLIVRALYWPVAAIYTVLFKMLSWAVDQNFVATAGPSALETMRAEYGLAVKGGETAQLAAQASGVAAPSISEGVLYQSGAGDVYKTAVLAEAHGGVVDLVLLAPEIGPKYELEAGAVLNLVSPILGVPDVALVSGVLVSGVAAETTEQKRARVAQRRGLTPQGGSAADYLAWATEVDGIIDIFAYTFNLGTISVYPIALGSGSERVPSQGQLDLVRQRIENSEGSALQDRRPMTAQVSVQAPVQEFFAIQIAGLRPNSADLRQDIARALLTYFDNLRAENPALNKGNNGGTVNRRTAESIIEGLASARGGTFDLVQILINGVDDVILRHVLPVASLATVRSLEINAEIEALP